MKIEIAFNMLEANGKTVRENNMELNHHIPCGTIVEVTCDNEDKGKLFTVIGLVRDCDGTPCYELKSIEKFIYAASDLKVV